MATPPFVYLINQASFAAYQDLSVNITPIRLNVHIKNAQILDLRLFMGQAFYTDFIKWFSNDSDGNLIIDTDIPQSYSDLFEGLIYTDKSGKQISYEGMIPSLIYWSFARFVEMDSVHYTSTGPVAKRHDEADVIGQKDIAKIVSMQRSVANAYANDIELYLYNNQTSFPLWRWNEKNKESRQPAARIRGIDRTRYNRGAYGYNSSDWNGNFWNGE